MSLTTVKASNWAYKNTAKIALAMIYLLLVAVVCFRVSVHPNQYTTPDSLAYLKQSELIRSNWSNGRYFEVKSDFTIWPVGYPLAIASVSAITRLSPLVSSKVVNLIFMGLFFLLLYEWLGKPAWFVALPVFSYGALEVVSETWSETPFIFFVFLLIILLKKKDQISSYGLFLGLSLTLMALFLFRYIGMIYLGLVFLISFIAFVKGEKKRALIYFGASFMAMLFAAFYFRDNYLSSGFITGEHRLEPGHIGFPGFAKKLAVGLVNELFISRNYFFDRQLPDPLFFIMLSLQISLTVFVIKKWRARRALLKYKEDFGLLSFTSISYLTGIILIGVFVPFDDFDFRILFPFGFPLYIGIMTFFVGDEEFYKKNWKPIALFMLLSLIVNLPKTYILSLF